MRRSTFTLALAAAMTASAFVPHVQAGQAPLAAAAPNIPISHSDRVYAAEQFSNTVSVVDPVDNRLLGEIKLGDPSPANFSPLYRGQVLVHGLGFSPDHHTLAAVSIGSNSVSFIDTASNRVLRTAYVGRSPHEAFYTPNGKEVWVTVRGEDYVSVLDAANGGEMLRIKTPAGPGMTIFSPDGKYAYVCSSFNPETTVIEVASHRPIAKVTQPSAFCPNIAATPDGEQVWFTLKDIGKATVFAAKPPFAVLKTLDIGPIANHVNFARTAAGQLAYVTVGGKNEVQVYRTKDYTLVATIPVGKLPHGVWPSGDGTRMYVGLENEDALAVIDTTSQKLIAKVAIGQAPQALAYVPNAVPDGEGTSGLVPLGLAGQAAHLSLNAIGKREPLTTVTLFEQGLVQVVQAAATGLAAKMPYVLALATRADGGGPLEALGAFTTNPAGAAIVNAIGPIRQQVQDKSAAARRYLVIAAGTPDAIGAVIQVQAQ